MESDPASKHCPNCGTPFKGDYCYNCGEKKLTERDFSLKALLSELSSGLNLLNNKFFRSLKLIILNPRRYFTDYLKGKRQPYLKPFQLFLLANALYFFVGTFNSFMTPLKVQQYQQPYSHLVESQIQTAVDNSALSANEFANRFNQKTTSLSKSILIVFVLFHSLFCYLFYLRQKVPFITIFQFSLIILAFLLAVLFIALPMLMYQIILLLDLNPYILTDAVYSLIIVVILTVYTFFLVQAFSLETKLMSGLKAIGITISFVVVTYIYRFILLQLTLLWM